MNNIKKKGKNPSLFVAQPVKWMNISQLPVRINTVFFLSSDILSSKYCHETVNASKVLSNSLDVKLNSLN